MSGDNGHSPESTPAPSSPPAASKPPVQSSSDDKPTQPVELAGAMYMIDCKQTASQLNGRMTYDCVLLSASSGSPSVPVSAPNAVLSWAITGAHATITAAGTTPVASVVTVPFGEGARISLTLQLAPDLPEMDVSTTIVGASNALQCTRAAENGGDSQDGHALYACALYATPSGSDTAQLILDTSSGDVVWTLKPAAGSILASDWTFSVDDATKTLLAIHVEVPDGESGAVDLAYDGQSYQATLAGNTPHVLGLQISPPASTLNVGDNVDFKAIASLSDGTTSDVTATATWASADPTSISMSGASAVGLKIGGATAISASLNGVSGSTEASVVPRTCMLNLAPTLVDLMMPAPNGTAPTPAGVVSGAATFSLPDDATNFNVVNNSIYEDDNRAMVWLNGTLVANLSAESTLKPASTVAVNNDLSAFLTPGANALYGLVNDAYGVHVGLVFYMQGSYQAAICP